MRKMRKEKNEISLENSLATLSERFRVTHAHAKCKMFQPSKYD